MIVRHHHPSDSPLATYERGIFGRKRLEHNLQGCLDLSDARARHGTAAIDKENILLSWEQRKTEAWNQSQSVCVRRLFCSFAGEITFDSTTRVVEFLGRNKDNNIFFQEGGGFVQIDVCLGWLKVAHEFLDWGSKSHSDWVCWRANCGNWIGHMYGDGQLHGVATVGAPDRETGGRSTIARCNDSGHGETQLLRSGCIVSDNRDVGNMDCDL
jgi:hypothetical protein